MSYKTFTERVVEAIKKIPKGKVATCDIPKEEPWP
jgi:alkylated DNA nucleotide flippase Atl1